MGICRFCNKTTAISNVCKSCSNRNRIITEETKIKISKSKLSDKNPMWKGEKVSYGALHDYVKSIYQKPNKCSCCGKKTSFLDLANKGIYNRNIKNWEWICRKCHMTKDGRLDLLRVNCGKNLNKKIAKIKKRNIKIVGLFVDTNVSVDCLVKIFKLNKSTIWVILKKNIKPKLYYKILKNKGYRCYQYEKMPKM